MAAALAVPPSSGKSRRPADAALALTASGRAELEGSLSRAPAARALFMQFAASPEAVSASSLAELIKGAAMPVEPMSA